MVYVRIARHPVRTVALALLRLFIVCRLPEGSEIFSVGNVWSGGLSAKTLEMRQQLVVHLTN